LASPFLDPLQDHYGNGHYSLNATLQCQYPLNNHHDKHTSAHHWCNIKPGAVPCNRYSPTASLWSCSQTSVHHRWTEEQKAYDATTLGMAMLCWHAVQILNINQFPTLLHVLRTFKPDTTALINSACTTKLSSQAMQLAKYAHQISSVPGRCCLGD